MIDPCRYCSSQRVAAVLDKQIEERPTAGNKYRKRCLECGRWLPCCSAADFQAADIQHVLPRGVDRESEDPTVPVSEYDGQVDGIQAGAGDTSKQALTDGGQDVEDDEGGQDVENSDENDEPDVNIFECPACGNTVEGHPDECPHDGCGVPYNWE